ncbi:hypothetical protein CVT25_000953 [Psilocybe cyanescens]|uniref:Uncharacterized protein n=1 Tax=Psilocybe cyanescens TaxID=93625 RepID=A0A409XS24_PSICY|nr:hypothetical protein CVT25_000953 [Psilocybe cyanescens]
MPRPSWSSHRPQSAQPDTERSHPERYIFLVLFLVLFIRLLKTLQKYRPQERFDPALDELDPESGVDPEVERQPPAINTQAVYWDDATGHSMGTSPGGTYHIRGRSNDDQYEAAVASLVSLENHHPQISPVPEHRIRDVHRIQRLVAKLRTASYSAQNDPEDSPGRREIASLRRQIAEIVLNESSNVANSLPPHGVAVLDPPPAYREIIHENDDSTAAPMPSYSSLPAPLISLPESVQ